MPDISNSSRLLVFGKWSFTVAALVELALTALATAAPPDRAANLQGTVQSGGTGLAGYTISLYASFVDQGPPRRLLGSGISDSAGKFRIAYSLPPGLAEKPSILFVEAEHGPVMLASAIGRGSSAPEKVVVNERTTVATGNAFAQFIDGGAIGGNTYGMINALSMAANLADPQTGEVGVVLASTPNGTETSTFPTFNSLANAVASCVADADNCTKLFEAATPRGVSWRSARA